MMTHMRIHMQIGDRKLDFYGIGNAFEARMNVEYAVSRRYKSEGAAARMLEPTRRPKPIANILGQRLGRSTHAPLHAPPVYVTPSDRASRTYLYRHAANGGAVNEEGDEVCDFGEHEGGEGEYDYRHPGTRWESDGEDEEEPFNDRFAPINTKVGQDLSSIRLAGPGGAPSCELIPAYKMQITVRTDDARQMLIYDAFEYKGDAIDAEDPKALPTRRSYNKFHDVVAREPKRRSHFGFGYSDDEDESDDDDDPTLDEPIEPTREPDARGRIAFLFQGTAGDFFASRCLRMRVPLASVCGARLHSPGLADGDVPDTCMAVLVLEFESPPPDDAFAARKIGSQYSGEHKFVTVGDWTPGAAATTATRHYITGDLVEIRELAAHLTAISPKMARLLAPPSPSDANPNTLAPPASLAFAAAPPFRGDGGVSEIAMAMAARGGDGAVPSLQALSATAAVSAGASSAGLGDAGYPQAAVASLAAAETAAAEAEAKKKKKLTEEDVHALMQEHLGISASEAEDANDCFKAAVLKGHITLDESSSLDTVLHSASCYCCSGGPLECTIRDVLDQAACGDDYGDGGEGAAIQCDECGGNYLSGLCEGRPHYTGGKFHNHCSECPDFGTCMGDYRNAHCHDCGNHYFAGMSGFSCEACGGGDGDGPKTKPIASLPPPPASAFDGRIDGAVPLVRSRMHKYPMMQRVMMMAAIESELGEGESAVPGLPAEPPPTDMVEMIKSIMAARLAADDSDGPMDPARAMLLAALGMCQPEDDDGGDDDDDGHSESARRAIAAQQRLEENEAEVAALQAEIAANEAELAELRRIKAQDEAAADGPALFTTGATPQTGAASRKSKAPAARKQPQRRSKRGGGGGAGSSGAGSSGAGSSGASFEVIGRSY